MSCYICTKRVEEYHKTESGVLVCFPCAWAELDTGDGLYMSPSFPIFPPTEEQPPRKLVGTFKQSGPTETVLDFDGFPLTASSDTTGPITGPGEFWYWNGSDPDRFQLCSINTPSIWLDSKKLKVVREGCWGSVVWDRAARAFRGAVVDEWAGMIIMIPGEYVLRDEAKREVAKEVMRINVRAAVAMASWHAAKTQAALLGA